MLFGQQANDSDGAVLWAAVADRLQRPLISQVAELEHEDGKVRGKRQTEFGYDVIEAPLPAVIAVSDAINEPRYPSLKGIMGAKKKPQETVSLGDLGVSADEVGEAGSRTEVYALARPARPRRHDQDRGRRLGRGEDSRVPAADHETLPRCPAAWWPAEDARLPRAPRGQAAERLARRARQGGRARGRGRGRAARRRRRGSGRRGGQVRRLPGPRRRRRAAGGPAPATAGRRSRASLGDGGHDTVLFAASVLSADVAAGLAARLDAGLNWDLTDLVEQDGRLVGKRPALGDSVSVDVGWTLGAASRARSAPAPSSPAETGGGAEVVKIEPRLQDFSLAARMVEQAHEESEGPSIEDADVIVAGGRGLGGPENFALVEELAKALGGAVAGDPRGGGRRLVPVRRPGRPDRQDRLAEALRRRRDLRARSSTRSACRAPSVIVAINKDPNAPIFEYADLGVVGDLHEIVPKLTELVRARKAA